MKMCKTCMWVYYMVSHNPTAPCEDCKDYDKWQATKPTNADRIRAMTDVELAMWMAVESWNYPPCAALIGMEDGTKECVQPDCTGCWLDWLKQECAE